MLRGILPLLSSVTLLPAASAQCELGALAPQAVSSQDAFGAAIDAHGLELAAGAPGADVFDGSATQPSAGSVTFFEYVQGFWHEGATLLPPVPVADGAFGHSVAFTGERVAVGEPGGDGLVLGSGVVHVFRKEGGQWVLEQRLEAGDAAAAGAFGSSVAASGERILVGAPGQPEGGSGRGAAYLFELSGGQWSQSAKLTLSSLADGDDFGRAVALEGEAVIVGAPGRDAGFAEAGAAYVYELEAGVWASRGEVVAGAPSAGAAFGSAVTLTGLTGVSRLAFIGAPLADGNQPGSGAVWSYIGFAGSDWGTWTQYFPGQSTGDAYGSALEVDAEATRVALGAPGVASSVGEVVVLEPVGNPWLESDGFAPAGGTSGDRLGVAVALAGEAVVGGAEADGAGVPGGGALRPYAPIPIFGDRGDCDGDGALDLCEIQAGAEADVDSDGLPDACQCATETYCTAAPNSVGPGCEIASSGRLSIAANSFELRASGGPPGKPALAFYGTNAIEVPFGNGFRCVGGEIQRLRPPQTFDASGNYLRPLDFTVPPLSSGAGEVTPLSTWHFQIWYRDSAAGGSLFNLSDGLRATFCR